MILSVSSVPDKCVRCGSTYLNAETPVEGETSNVIVCQSCGGWMVVNPEGCVEHVKTSPPVCPHCMSAEGIKVEMGDEWCANCGLDPNEDGYGPAELSLLWARGSGIRAFMAENRPNINSRYFRFLKNHCGPHCTMEDMCTQSTREFVVCFKIEARRRGDADFLDVEEILGDTVTSARAAYMYGRIMQASKPVEAPVVALYYASNGWYERIMKLSDETDDTGRCEDTGT